MKKRNYKKGKVEEEDYESIKEVYEVVVRANGEHGSQTKVADLTDWSVGTVSRVVNTGSYEEYRERLGALRKSEGDKQSVEVESRLVLDDEELIKAIYILYNGIKKLRLEIADKLGEQKEGLFDEQEVS